MARAVAFTDHARVVRFPRGSGDVRAHLNLRADGVPVSHAVANGHRAMHPAFLRVRRPHRQGSMMLATSDDHHERDESRVAIEAAVGTLSMHLAHDFDSIWAAIFGLIQQPSGQPGYRNRDEAIAQIKLASGHGVLYSRCVMGVLRNPALVGAHEFDLCAAVREWSYRTGEGLAGSIDLSYRVPSHPLLVRFNRNTLDLVLLALLGYALCANEARRWAMIGVRSVASPPEKSRQAERYVDLMFLCRQRDGEGRSRDLQRRIEAIRDVSRHYGATVERWAVAGVGIASRIRFPRHSADDPVA